MCQIYKILILKRASSIEPLWTFHKVENVFNGEVEMVDFETDSETVVEKMIDELSKANPNNDILPIKVLFYTTNTTLENK